MLKHVIAASFLAFTSTHFIYTEENKPVVVVEEKEEELISQKIIGSWKFDVDKMVELQNDLGADEAQELLEVFREISITIDANSFTINSPENMGGVQIMNYEIINETPESLTIKLAHGHQDKDSIITVQGDNITITTDQDVVPLIRAEQ